jgi:hypothetical protein
MSEAEQYWDERAAKLRRLMGFCPLTPAQAEEALRKTKNGAVSDVEIDALVDAVSRGEIPIPEEPEGVIPTNWSPEEDFAALEADAVLFRNEGDGSQQPDRDEEELLDELLNDDEEDEGDGLE